MKCCFCNNESDILMTDGRCVCLHCAEQKGLVTCTKKGMVIADPEFHCDYICNINMNSNVNNNPKNDLIKEIYNIEEKIQKEQNEPSKMKNKILCIISMKNKILGIISLIGSFGCCIPAAIFMGDSLAVSLIFVCIEIALLCIGIWSVVRAYSETIGKPQSVIEKLQTQLDDLLFIDEKSINFYRECSKMIIFAFL